MNSFFIVILCVTCLFANIQSAAVEPVVEELQSQTNPAEAIAESVLTTNEDCIQPKETGRCFALFYRFAFDVEKRECVEFIYGGCAGNSNNFETKDDCESKCIRHVEDSAKDSLTTAEPELETATEQVVISY